MTTSPRFFFSFLFFLITSLSDAQFTYISPMPGSKLHNKETSIILRTGKLIDASSLAPNLVSINGSVSGTHDCKIKLARDGKSILIYPEPILASGESVSVVVKDGIRNENGELVQGTTFQFETRPDYSLKQLELIRGADDENQDAGQHSPFPQTDCNHLPAVHIVSTPGAYYDADVFYQNHAQLPNNDCFRATIISSEGDSIYSHYDNKLGFGIKINLNGYLTYYNVTDSCFDMLDSSYNLVKQFFMGNGYNADEHEFIIQPDGYHFLMCLDKEPVDMTQYGGPADAIVCGTVIQELDPDNNVIFEWTSWDHFLFTDADANLDLTTGVVDYIHTNSIDLDYDGNLLVSSRNFDEITKIDLSTGDIMWRMGGENNQFTFINETSAPKPFSRQHDFMRLPNGHYTMMDNGNFQTPATCIAKEYVLDEVNKTATLVWSYQHPQVNGYYVESDAFGNVQYLPNGNRLIDWGRRQNEVFADIPNFTEVDSLGNIVWELSFVDSFYDSYRVYKFPWERCNLIADSSLLADNITETSSELSWSENAKFTGFVLEYKKCSETNWNSIPLDTNFYELGGLEFNACYDWRVLSICSIYDDSSYTLVHQFNTLNPLSVSENDDAISSQQLFPDPATGNTTLKFYSHFNGQSQITIRDLLGRELKIQTVPVYAGLNKFTILLDALPSATYLVETKMNNEIRVSRLVVKD